MKLFGIVAVAALGISAASPASAIIINNMEVGGVDTIISITNDTGIAGTGGTTTNTLTGCASNSGDDTELCWAEFFTGPSTLSQYAKPISVPIFYGDVMGTVYGAFDLTGNPEYYIVKNSTVSILMQNVADLGWGVLDTANAQTQIDAAGFIKPGGNPTKPKPANVKLNLGVGHTTISHVTQYNNASEVPEPAMLALLGVGLAGFGLSRRTVFRKKLDHS